MSAPGGDGSSPEMAERYGDFELQRLIATGGMAEIYLATHGGLGDFSRSVVVKRMLPQLAVRPDFVQMFLDEARLAANLTHPNIVQVFNLGEVDKSYYIAMELVDGPHLGTLFAHSLRMRKPLPIEHCVYVVARASDGLHYAHERADPATGLPLEIVHRDISPQNILVSRQGDVKVTDFGVAKAATQQTKTRTGIIKGKVAYMSPEQCLGELVDRRTDVFALGIVLYELVTRRRLFRDKSDLLIMQKITGEDVPPPSSHNKELDAELDAICLRALARDRSARYASAAELSEALDTWLGERAGGDARAQLQRWLEQNALELTLGAQADRSSPSIVTENVRSTPPAERTAATPSLNSLTRTDAAGKSLTELAPPEPVLASVAEPTRQAPSPARGQPEKSSSEEGTAPANASLPDATVLPADSEATSIAPADFVLPPPARRTHATTALVGAAAATVALALLLLVAWDRDDNGPPAPSTSPVASFPTSAPVDAPAAPSARPAASASAAAMGRITVESVPSGVPILVDDERVAGKTPFTFEHAPGTVKLQAQFSDQPPLGETIEVAPGEERSVRLLALVPLVVKSDPAKAKVRLDGELLGETPLEKPGLVRPERKVRVRLELAGHTPLERELTPAAGVPLVVEATLEKPRAEARIPVERKPAFGFLNMRSTPWVNVRIQSNGQRLGATILAQAKVPAGRQTLVLTNAEQGINEALTVVVPENKAVSVTLEWEKKGADWRIKAKTIK